MKSVEFNSPILFLMLGYAGAGKTFFARQYAEAIGAIHLSSDRIRRELFDAPSFSKEENQVVFRMMDMFAEEMLSRGISVVYDAQNNQKNHRRQKRKMAAKHKAETLIIWVQTDLETSFERASKRDRRNPDDKYTYELDRQAFDRLKNELTRPDEREDYVVVSGKHVFRNQLHVVLKKLESLEYFKVQRARN